jgi:SHS2 domain-containing protein
LVLWFGSAMNQPYEFFDHTADIGVRVHGATLPALFANAARAMFTVLGELKKTGDRRQKTVELRAESLEDLLHDWLAELLYAVETEHVLYDEFEISNLQSPVLTATVRGGPIDFAESQPNEEIKAVTYHRLDVHQLPDGSWQATVIFDV